MAAKTIARREIQREALIDAAEAAIGRGGLAGLKTREIAREAGCALGAIYNLVADMDELVLRVGSRTLARLDAALVGAGGGRLLKTPEDAIERLVAIAVAYGRFAGANRNLWRTLFEHQMADGKAPPDWAIDEQMRLFDHAVTPLRVLMARADDTEVLMMSRTLFAAVHGVVLFGVEGKMISVPHEALEQAVDQFVRVACAGVRVAEAREAAM